jgi:hypothetical protein
VGNDAPEHVPKGREVPSRNPSLHGARSANRKPGFRDMDHPRHNEIVEESTVPAHSACGE